MLRESELASRANGVLELRPGGLRLQWDLPEITTSDGHRLHGRFGCMVQAMSDPLERKMLAETLFASRAVVTASDVREHFFPSLRTVGAKFSKSTAEGLLTEIGQRDFCSALEEAAKTVAFACGLEILQPIALELDCPTLRRQKASQRQVAEQSDHLNRSAEMFAQFQKIRDALPDLPAGQILQRIRASDQAEVLRSLVEIYARKTVPSRLLALAGSNLIEIDLQKDSSPKVVPLPEDLGPLRSVRGDGCGRLLIGARAGLLVVDDRSFKTSGSFRAGSVDSQLGFNAGVVLANRIWASHSEAGLVSWEMDRPDEFRRHGEIRAARNLTKLGENRLIFSSCGKLFSVDSDQSIQPIGAPASADILAIFAESDRVLAVYEDGLIRVFDPHDWNDVQEHRRSGRLSAAGILPWLGETRLLLAGETGPIVCAGLEDEIVTQYASAHLSPRIVAGSDRCVAAVSADRQKLLVWNSWEGRAVRAELNLAAITQHRISDFIFISSQ